MLHIHSNCALVFGIDTFKYSMFGNIIIIATLLFIAYHNMTFDDDERVDNEKKKNFKFHSVCVHMQ
jgi:hypothetical protein